VIADTIKKICKRNCIIKSDVIENRCNSFINIKCKNHNECLKPLYFTTYFRRMPFSSAGLFHDTFRWWEPFSMTVRFLTSLGAIYNKQTQLNRYFACCKNGSIHSMINLYKYTFNMTVTSDPCEINVHTKTSTLGLCVRPGPQRSP